MKIATIYTLYGRRAGAELCFEKTVFTCAQLYPNDNWLIFCNKQSFEVMKDSPENIQCKYIPLLDNQLTKAFWLEFISQKFVNKSTCDCFWVPSGCNQFPGKWNVPTLSTFHDLGEFHISHKYSVSRMIYRKRICIPLNVKRAKGFTSVSKFTKDDMVKYLGLPDSLIKVIYNGNTPYSLEIPKESKSIIKELGLHDKGYFFTPGRTDYIGKGLDILLKAYRDFGQSHQDIKLVLVGPEGEGHQKLLEDIGNDDNIKYLGRVDDATLVSLYSNSLVTILASRFEGFGFPVLEAMKYDSLIISSDAGALKEIAGNAAIIFKSEDYKDLLKKMYMVFDIDKNAIEDFKEKGKKRLAFFSWQKCAKEMMEEFRKVSKNSLGGG